MGLLSMQEILKNILNSGVDLIVFGETEHGKHEKIFEMLSKCGNLFKGIFLELPADYQNSVDTYLKRGAFDKAFESLLKGALLEGKDFRKTYTLIFDYAKKKNLPIICIDSSKTKTREYKTKSLNSYSYFKSDSRDGDMFLNVTKILKEKGGKWCLVAHAAHIDYDFDLYKNNPSLGKRLKGDLKKRLFTICLYQSPNIRDFSYLLTDQMNNVILPINGDPKKSFDAVILHS